MLHGVTVRDPYRWLEDEKSPEVNAWMKAEDALARKELAALPERDALAARLKELLYVDTLGAPIHRGTRYFTTHRRASQEKSVVVWKEGAEGDEKVLLDPNAWSDDGSAGLGAWSVSWDGKKVAYGKKVNNSDEATLYVMDVATGKVSDVDVIEGAKYAHASWTPDGVRVLLHEAARGPEDPGLRPAGLGGRSAAPDRDRPEDRHDREGEARRPDGVPERRGDARRALPLPPRAARLDLDRPVVPRPREESGRDKLDAARRRDQGPLQRRHARAHALRPDGRRRAEGTDLRRRSGADRRGRRGRRSSPNGATPRSRASASSAGSSRSTT